MHFVLIVFHIYFYFLDDQQKMDPDKFFKSIYSKILNIINWIKYLVQYFNLEIVSMLNVFLISTTQKWVVNNCVFINKIKALLK